MEVEKKKESVLGYISLAFAIIVFIVFFAGYFLYLEMSIVIVNLLTIAVVGILFGMIGVILSFIKKVSRKRIAVIGLSLNILFIVFVISFLYYAMGGP